MKKIALSKLLKLEVPRFVGEVIRIVSKYDTKALNIDSTFQLLVNQQSNVALLTVPYGPHDLTELLCQLNLKRLNYAAIITTQMRALEKVELEKTKQLVKVARPSVRLYLNYLRQNNQTYIQEMINGFFIHLRENPEVHCGLVELGFKFYLDELQSANITHEKVFLERLESISKRPRVDSRAIQKEVQGILRILFEQIDYYQYAYKSLNYEPMINELNGLITRFTNLINTRATVNKRKTTNSKQSEAEESSSDQEKSTEAETEGRDQDAEEGGDTFGKKRNL